MDDDLHRRRKRLLVCLMILVPVLFFMGWSQTALNLSFIRPASAQQTILLLVLSAVIFLAFIIFALILFRILLKLYVERRQQQLGSKFKTKMVVAFLSISLVPVCVLFIFAYGLINRSLDRWFGIPFDIVRRDAGQIVQQLESQAEERALEVAEHLASREEVERSATGRKESAVATRLARKVSELRVEGAVYLDERGRVLGKAGKGLPDLRDLLQQFPALDRIPAGGIVRRHTTSQFELFIAARPVMGVDGTRQGTVICASRLPLNIVRTAEEIRSESHKYDQLSRERKAVKLNYLSMLWLLTLVILFIATWFALFFSKQVTVPIQALAEATHELSKGNLNYQVSVRADDELGSLIQSFNEMTQQLAENRKAIERAARELQDANQALDERGNTMEAILESIPTGVISFDPQGQIIRMNSSVERLFKEPRVKGARSLSDLFSSEDVRDIARLFRRAARQGVITRQLELGLAGRRAFVAVTVSSIRTRHGTAGSVLVIEDLSEMLRAQRAMAWQEVAQRIAHEIKNPLTPIQLSTERIRRLVERSGADASSPDLVARVAESTSLISREVETLKALVDEFSSFARFPASKPVPSSLNTIVENAVNVFNGRLNGIDLHCELAPDLPPVSADPEQIKRAIVNLVDNAAEALEQSLHREIWVRTSLEPDRDVVELMVADSGPGIPPEAKEALFLPSFSTKHRGTGLGLAIVSRIVSEHHGSIRVEENRPSGTKFVIELPVERATAEAAT
jgi:two-component system nitrogen regulation sensor histidine kinase NtrY